MIDLTHIKLMFALIIGMFVAAFNETLMGNALPD
ncbi:MAG: hypothetical protein K0Q73_9162 [Paenibacillus sp.]|jgi:DHA2 family lincomycin resistance protein-like MFS transporter|nr:hypothetical protein [Paenibacillus sp.]